MKFVAILPILVMIVIPTSSFAVTDYLSKNDIQYCEQNYQHYLLLGEYKFLERELRTIESRVCVHLYNDQIWEYAGTDRIQRLLDRGNYYVSAEIEKSKIAAKTGVIEHNSAPITDLQKAGAKILEQEKTIRDLEKKLMQKDEIILEQAKVIMQLVEKIKSTFFEIVKYLPSAL